MSRYGGRIIPNTDKTMAALRARGQLVQGPHIADVARAAAVVRDAVGAA